VGDTDGATDVGSAVGANVGSAVGDAVLGAAVSRANGPPKDLGTLDAVETPRYSPP